MSHRLCAFVRVGVVVALISASSSVTVSAGAAPGDCVFDPDTATVTITAPKTVELVRVGDAIVANGEACGAATVTTTDVIVTTRSLTLDLRGGPFAPGLTDEGDGSSEIEFETDWTPVNDAVLTIEATRASDRISMWSEVAADRTRTVMVNLDANEAVPDAEFVYLPEALVFLQINARAGDDVVDGGGGGGNDEAYTDTVYLFGGPGDDRYLAARNESVETSLFEGEGGIDVLDASSVPIDEPVVIAVGPDGGGLVGGGSLGIPGIERVLGHSGEDTFYGGAGSQQLFGRGGDDLIRGGRDNDRLVGGKGADELRGGNGVDRCDVDPADISVVLCEREI